MTMARERTEIAELIAKIYDRLEQQFDGKLEINDAILLVETTDPTEDIELEDGRTVNPTLVLLECTSDRVVVQAGILTFAVETILYGRGDADED
jgi:hypothetical protein